MQRIISIVKRETSVWLDVNAGGVCCQKTEKWWLKFNVKATLPLSFILYFPNQVTAMDDNDMEFDMFQSIKPTELPAAPTKSKQPVIMSDSEDDLSEEEKFIAKENMAANRKNKKSGGFQSMGKWKQVFQVSRNAKTISVIRFKPSNIQGCFA